MMDVEGAVLTPNATWPTEDPRIDEILDIIAKEAGVTRASLLPDTPIASLDIASLDMVQAMFAIESRFDVEIPVLTGAGEAEFATMGDLVRHVLAVIHGSVS